MIDDPCPGCRATHGVQQITGTSPKVWAWAVCRTDWAVTTVNPSPQPFLDRLAATVEQLGRLRWLLGQVVILGADADGLSDEQLRTRLLALAESCAE